MRQPSKSTTPLLSLALLLVAACSPTPAAQADTDIAALCAPYGGVVGDPMRSHRTQGTRLETSVMVDCKDGSWVSRTWRGR